MQVVSSDLDSASACLAVPVDALSTDYSVTGVDFRATSDERLVVIASNYDNTVVTLHFPQSFLTNTVNVLGQTFGRNEQVSVSFSTIVRFSKLFMT